MRVLGVLIWICVLVAAFSCCFRGFAGWVLLGNLWCGKMREANTLWRKIWDTCRDGSLIWFCWWCGGFNKLGLWGNSQTRKWVTLQLIFACNSWLHSLHISVSFSFSSLSLIYCWWQWAFLFWLTFCWNESIKIYFTLWFTIHDDDCVRSFSFFFFYLILAEIWWVGFLKKKSLSSVAERGKKIGFWSDFGNRILKLVEI